jgi:succinylglutamic semialdehyde dehydrogenase
MSAGAQDPSVGCSQAPAHWIGGEWESAGEACAQLSDPGHVVRSANPAHPSETVWMGQCDPEAADRAVAAARAAWRGWRDAGLEARKSALLAWQSVTQRHMERIARCITREMGKTLAESRLEAKALGEKVSVTLDPISQARVSGYEVPIAETRRGICAFRPHGVMAVIAPFNFPAHLANGHIVPALLAGNTVVLKPSERTPAVGQLLAELSSEAGFPQGVFNVVQGGAATAARLVAHQDIDGILFTGSWPVGRRILQANIDRPGRIVALEMGGSNAAIVCEDCDLRQAVIECVRASFATTGQRCTCTRRIIVHASVADRFIAALGRAASTLVIGPGDASEPVFMGPLVTESAMEAALQFQRERARAGARVVLQSARVDREGWFVTPGIMEVDRFTRETDAEVFAPIVQVSVARGDDDLVDQANATEFGLAASVFTQDRARWDRISRDVRAGCVNWNVGTAGASSKLPFGGLGLSGNHRPAAAFSVDYCAYPVAHMEERSAAAAVPEGMLWKDTWLS